MYHQFKDYDHLRYTAHQPLSWMEKNEYEKGTDIDELMCRSKHFKPKHDPTSIDDIEEEQEIDEDIEEEEQDEEQAKEKQDQKMDEGEDEMDDEDELEDEDEDQDEDEFIDSKVQCATCTQQQQRLQQIEEHTKQ